MKKSGYKKFINNENLEQQFKGKIWSEEGETMIGYKRLPNLESCVIKTLQNNIQGDLLETGVWRGGACILMMAILKKYVELDKKVWVADSFKGNPKPNPKKYKNDIDDLHHTFKKLAVSRQEVKGNFKKYNLLTHR